MRSKRVTRVGLLLLLTYLALSLLAGVFLAEIALHPMRRPLTEKDETQARRLATNRNWALDDVVIAAGDGSLLRGWNVRPKVWNGNVVILFHGVGDNRLGMTGYAEMLSGHGFDVLLPDARAHGSSGGPIATYGLLESDDIRRWTAWIETQQRPNCIFGLGESMGAAQVLQSLGAGAQFCAVVAESPFSTFREIAYDRVGQYFRTGPWLGRTAMRPIVEVAFAYARWKYTMDFEKASPELALAGTTVPVLLIHGKEDRNIPVRHSEMIVAQDSQVVLWEVPNADHCGAVNVAPAEFEHRLLGWFEGHARGHDNLTRAVGPS
jgi:hypothetical protein